MLRVTVGLEPHGNVHAGKAVAEVEIVNVTADPAGLRMTQDYAWRIRETRSGLTATGWLVDWRRGGTSLHLLAAVLDEWRSGRPLPTDRHGNPAEPQGQDNPEEFWRKHDEDRT